MNKGPRNKKPMYTVDAQGKKIQKKIQKILEERVFGRKRG